MYIPSLLDSAVMADMNAKGCQLTTEDIYSFNQNSLKDAVPQFGGGCTGGMISNEGLLVTNHHCGLFQIQRNSTVEHDYLTNGFWAANKSEEIPCSGLMVTFVIRIDDVTDSIIPFLNNSNSANEIARQNTVDSISKILSLNAIANSHYGSFVRAFYNGNQYFRFLIEVFNDVRLVGAPPICIGNFGGDTDNWMWPRHTGDFSLFRVYADKENNPA
ncbi:MAG: S46 family peptidase, partial [Pseudomonadota bacterium]